ncbi:hypothetical protein AGMMS50256_26120 [Betaproteobacteria bacterium]|nr:hypothetical protein AGMMS50256_26120 [Betaproteobacteria bacterium]
MKYLLDTCTVSDFIKGEPGILNAIIPLIVLSSAKRRIDEVRRFAPKAYDRRVNEA